MTDTSEKFNNKPGINTFTYAAPSGSVVDANLWLFDQQLFRFRDDLNDYKEFDDLWMSYVLDALVGWDIIQLMRPQPVNIATIDEEVKETMFPQLPLIYCYEQFQ